VKNEELYRNIKIVGLMTYVPVILAAGPLAGYVLGDYVQKKFVPSPFILLLCMGLGFLTGLVEIVRIIRLILKMEKKF
jgi:hypothetical protein